MTDTITKAAQALIAAIKIDRHDWEDWPNDSRKAFEALKAAIAAPQPEQEPVSHDNLKGVDAGPLSEWVDLVKRGYVPKDELLIRASDAARVVAQSEPQPVKQAPQYCGTSHCSCIECVMEKKT